MGFLHIWFALAALLFGVSEPTFEEVITEVEHPVIAYPMPEPIRVPQQRWAEPVRNGSKPVAKRGGRLPRPPEKIDDDLALGYNLSDASTVKFEFFGGMGDKKEEERPPLKPPSEDLMDVVFNNLSLHIGYKVAF